MFSVQANIWKFKIAHILETLTSQITTTNHSDLTVNDSRTVVIQLFVLSIFDLMIKKLVLRAD